MLLFGEQVGNIDLYFVLRLLNGIFTNIKKFKEVLKQPTDVKNSAKFGNFLRYILTEYPIDDDYVEKQFILTTKFRLNNDIFSIIEFN